MAVPSNLSALLDALPNSENKLGVLGDIKLIVNSMNPNNVRESVRNVSFNVIFECLDTTDSEQIKACCDVLDKLLSASDAVSVVNTFHRELLLGLNHPSDTVQRLTLSQLLRGAQASVQQVLQHVDVITVMVNILALESLDIVHKSAQILTILATTPEGLEVLFHSPVIDQFNHVLQQGDIVAYRVFEWVVDVCSLGHEAMNCCTAAGLLQRLVNDLHKNDVLIQLNCVDMLSKMAISLHGLQYLERQGVVHTLEGMMEGVDSDPMMHFLLPGLLKFFGRVGHRHPRKVCERFPRFLSTLLTLVEDDSDASLQSIAVETIGFIGHTVEGKHALAKHNPQINQVCKKIGQVLSSDAVSLRRIRFLVALSNLLHLDVSEQTTELLSTTESWFYHLSSDPLSVFMKLAQQPFVEIRKANLDLFDELANQPWAQKLMNNYAGFKEFLLDRSTEKTKEGKEAKYKVVRTLVNAPTTLDVFGRVYMMKLREYHNEGPFYVTVETAVDYEEAS